MRRAWLVASVVGALAAGCDAAVPAPIGLGSEGHEGPPERGGWLHIATAFDARTLDPATGFDEVSGTVEQLVFAKLLDFDPSGKGFVPDLATSWRTSDDGRRVTFQLRQGALFHDGTEVRAADIKRSIERTLHPDTPCPASAFYERIEGYREYVDRKAPHLAGVVVEGDYVLAIALSEPDATLLSVLALPFMAAVCRSAGERYDASFARQACGAGPYRLQSWEPGRQVRVERFDGYHDRSRPYLDGIEYSFGVPGFSQRLKFERGEIDFIRELGESDQIRYLASPLWKDRVAWEPSRSVYALFMNTEMAPFDNREVRRAVASAIDRAQIVSLRPGTNRVAERIVPPDVPGHDESPGQRFDLGRALDLMRQAGHPYDPATGRGGIPGEIPYLVNAGSFDLEAGQVIQQQLARIGIRIRLRPVGWPAYLAQSSRRHTTVMGSDGWSADFLDPSNFFEPLFSRQAISDEESQNRSFYASATLDEKLERARRETDPGRRLALYHEAENQVLDDAPWAVLYSTRILDAWHPYLHGYLARQTRLAFTWIDRRARDRRSSMLSPASGRLALLPSPLGRRAP